MEGATNQKGLHKVRQNRRFNEAGSSSTTAAAPTKRRLIVSTSSDSSPEKNVATTSSAVPRRRGRGRPICRGRGRGRASSVATATVTINVSDSSPENTIPIATTASARGRGRGRGRPPVRAIASRRTFIVDSNNSLEHQPMTSTRTIARDVVFTLRHETHDSAPEPDVLPVAPKVRALTNAERQRNFRTRQSALRAEEIKQQNAEQHRLQRQQQSPNRTEEIRTQNNEQHRHQRQQQSPNRTEEIRQQDAEQHRLQRQQQSPNRTEEIRQQDAEQHRQQQQQQAVSNARALQLLYRYFIAMNADIGYFQRPRFDEALVEEHTTRGLNVICQDCGALHFTDERPRDGLFTNCCRKGRLRLPDPIHPYPSWLRSALTNQNDRYFSLLRSNIRNYNSSLSFVSLGANITLPPGRGPYCFQINGMTYHKMNSLDVPNQDEERRYAQLYFLDSSTQANNTRMNHPANANLNRELLREMENYIRHNNHYAQIFRHTQDMIQEAEANGEDPSNIQLVFNKEYQMQDVHPGRQNEVMAQNEVAAVFVLENDGVPNFHRDFAVYVRSDAAQADPTGERRNVQIHPQSPHIDPMTYVVLFINGEPGWNPNLQLLPYPRLLQEPRHFSLQQFKAAELQVRDTPYRPILDAANLTQQFIVDSYLQIEANNLNWIRMNQDVIKAVNYDRLQRFVERRAEQQNVEASASIILPSSFQGSNRHMRQLCQDAMAIFARFGKPDLFITFTCNPRWKDITDCLKPGEQASDCPHIVSRVFNIKLKSLIADIKEGLLGPSVCLVYTIEFQKRGLPHAHILVTVQNGHKPVDAESIDRIVCAELPNRDENPRLFNIVTSTMVHGPCRVELCMVDGHCSKGFPKAYANETVVKSNEYPVYRRREMPAETVTHGNHHKTVTNAFLVPYNPFLTLKYNAHINVEIVTSMRSSIKYIYKYVYKGFDVASLKFTVGGQLISNEVSNYINCRYVSAPEAMWRIAEFKMHNHSHSVTRLPIHLENPTELHFDGGLEIEPEREERTATTMLEAYFQLNEIDENARQYLYAEIPEHYVFNKAQRRWNQRQQRGDRKIARIHDINMNSIERFALRVLLLNVRGAQSFTALRNVNGQPHETFNAAAQTLNLVRNDDVFILTFDNLVTMRLPPQLRDALANMLLTFTITDGLNFWNRYRDEMIEDFRRMPQFANSTVDELYNLALHALNQRFAPSGRNNATFGLPDPHGPAVILTAAQPTLNQALQDIALNPAQQHGFDRIMDAANASRLNQEYQRTFVLIGPGGSGKTTLYRKIIDACTQRGLKARVFATTGIAATLMPGGLTVHRGFGLPLNMNAQSTSWFQQNLTSPACQDLARTDIFLIDEVTMMVKHGINIIDRLLRTLMNVNEPFGGKVIVFGGDFRQLLPVVPRGTRADIVAESVLASDQWSRFEVISLNQNMRAQRDPVFADWLLKLGTGSLPVVMLGDRNMIEIPQAMLLQIPPQTVAAENNNSIRCELKVMIQKVFGDDINNLTRQELTSRSILTTNLKDVMKINNIMIARLNGNARTYFSVDEIISDDPNDQYNFPPEYLNAQIPSGIPPHELHLKVGAVVMLIRNLDPEKGLSNGTRLIITELLENAIVAEISSESHQGDVVFIFRMDLLSEDIMMPVKMKRQQFPVIPAFAMTINKSQGQSIENLGIYLNDVVFSHGQLYVALSRSRNSRNISVFIRDQGTRQGHLMRNVPEQQHRVFTRNVVYREVFQHGELAILPNLEELDPDMANAIRLEMDNDHAIRNVQIAGESEQDAEDEQYPELSEALTDEEDALRDDSALMDDNNER